MSTELSCIGKPTARPDALDKVEGRTRYAGDHYLPGMLHGVVRRGGGYCQCPGKCRGPAPDGAPPDSGKSVVFPT